jgi:hypothetical protein
MIDMDKMDGSLKSNKGRGIYSAMGATTDAGRAPTAASKF